MKKINILYSFLVVFLLNSSVWAQEYDLVIYGGTSAGVAAAIQASRMERSVVLIEPTQRLGGLTTGGLGQTDIGNKQAIGGIAREFYQQIKAYYDQPEHWVWQKKAEYMDSGQTRTKEGEDAMWTFEPSAALEVYQQLLKDENVTLVYNERLLRENKGVQKSGNQIRTIQMESGKTFTGKMFMDATYEGDLMATAGVSYTVGRESNEQYKESLNGVQANYWAVTLKTKPSRNARNHNFVPGVDPYIEKGNPNSGLLPYITEGGPGIDGSGDNKVQASLSSREIDNGSSSTCGRIVEENLSQSTFTCSDVGENLVLYTVIDTEGNQAETLIIVTVIDPEAPAISRTPKSITEAFTDGQIFEIPDYRISYPATDNCSVAEFIQFPSPGTTLDAQGTYPITLTARDTYGNEVQAGFDLILSSSGGKGRGKNKFVRNESLIPVPWNTPEKEIASFGFERDNNGQKEELPVIWDLSSYNGLIPGIYEIHGQVQDKEPVLIWVKVAEKAMPEGILIFENELTEFLQKDQVLATLETIDPEDDQHTYQILESQDLEVRGNQLIWKGETQKANYPLDFRVKSIDRVGQVIEKDMMLDRGVDRADFEMYPNPATDFVELQVKLTGPSHVSIQVFDLSGKVLIKDEGEYESGFNKSLEVKSFAAGTYLVQVQINYQVEMKRLIIKK